jgi:ATP-dependent RNA circularization protein (DNA/RNA ligase family)
MSVWSLLAVDFEILAQSREASSSFLNFLKLLGIHYDIFHITSQSNLAEKIERSQMSSTHCIHHSIG